VILSEQLPHRINGLAVVALEEAEVPHELVYGRASVDELVLRSNRAIAGDFSFQALKGGCGIKALTPTLSSLSMSGAISTSVPRLVDMTTLGSGWIAAGSISLSNCNTSAAAVHGPKRHRHAVRSGMSSL